MDPKSRWEQERQESKKQRELSIMEAAERVFIRKGLEKTTMQDIAAEDNVGVATVFRYFPRKEKLVVAVAAKRIEDQVAVFQSVADMPGTCLDKLGKLFDIFISFTEPKYVESMRMLEAFENYAALSTEPLEDIALYNQAHHRVSAIFSTIIEDGLHDGSIRPDIPVQETLSTLANTMGIFSKKLSLQKNIIMLESDLPPETQLLLLKRIFLDYLKAPAGSSSS
ncbi:MAG: TetR family transcriptional regulator [Paenibacillus sp.]|jgi:AcrR family transcriptional regulator|uniref:TetR/AcrR family transcriptional regulator n=1 Tax=Paenibacillus sp. GCM10012303 TaxID=3317340 RepID=UPI0029EB8FE2|nr:TetR family transcriptional regulator [Paenibacillus sp.]